ncbi:MAG: hypothetical protein KF788_02685 [Piscinibacter sp.]|nr:hypothetical protein [Piscinibacter sp.]
MDRLMVLELESAGCSAEAVVNGLPVVALPATGGSACLAVHEYIVAGRNQIGLAAGVPPPGQPATPQPRVAIGPTWARARLVLVRAGQAPSDPNARVLSTVEWAVEEGQSYEAPVTRTSEVELPVNFPRWRWLDAPPIALNAATQRQILEFLQQLAVELGRGNAEPLLAAAKLRFDELALAYQSTTPEGMQRFRDQLQRLFEQKALKIVPPLAESLLLRPVAGARLIECLDPLGAPVLRTQNDDATVGDQSWPIRLAMVEGKIYVLR